MKLRYCLLTAAYCAFIFWISSQPQPIDPQYKIEGLDKVAHVLLYGGLAALVSTGIRRSNPGVRTRVQFWLPIAFACAYGITDELHQYFIPDRSFDPLDLIADAAGALIAQYALCRWRWRLGRL